MHSGNDGPASPITRRTLAHYDERAESFWEGTRDHDVSQNIATLLRHIEAPKPFAILDFGCGPGRDLRTLADMGHSWPGATAGQLAASSAGLSATDLMWDFFAAHPRKG